MNDLLIDQARALINRIDVALYTCYEWHPHLGDIPIAGTNRRRMKIKRIRQRAQYRLNRRLYAAGYPIPIRGAMMFINQADSGYF